LTTEAEKPAFLGRPPPSSTTAVSCETLTNQSAPALKIKLKKKHGESLSLKDKIMFFSVKLRK